ncbi:heavy-metal-associated domain-containing protein [Clostridium botulinum]|nr:heavy-metal-associated domain-containing protein [Clostridium botulinum]NFI17284.1 heavy-metal-associated domain-containing protein [Clostridium botulinum]NFL92140.1 heavy-metal-associated domain-containing protein [Clostridium botulinum]NFN52087.1 heavy-metal-associated domain-containing protein [Clostridium botulinum]NFO26701.1 heavy-metal-associated domain-containing protein [Clostridium botulinum]
MEREHYIIQGLSNSNMKTQVKNALIKIEGVNQVCIDVARESVEIIYNSPATPSKIRNCIYHTGHNIE